VDEASQSLDRTAIDAVLAGDVAAYQVLVNRHGPMLLRVAHRITGNGADAEEVVQEALLKAYRKLDTWAGQATVGSWLYRITVRCAYDLVESRQRVAGVWQSSVRDDDGWQRETADTGAGPEEQVLARELGDQQRNAMRALTALERTAFVLRHVEGQSIAEIGAVLGLGASATKQAIFRAVAKMRVRLAPLKELR
jgi:RNA polymerase sigma-70 factor (ECF subfamily)